MKLINNFKLKVLGSGKGITLVEVVVIIFIMALFSAIMIINFPEIQRRMALSRATHKLGQDLRKTLDLSLSGVPLKDIRGASIAVKGYGIYIDLSDSPARQYIIYADVADRDGEYDQSYSGDLSYPLCDSLDSEQSEDVLVSDCVVEIVDISKENPSLYINRIENIDADNTSINFTPPNPVINITNRSSSPQIEIVLGITTNDSSERIVSVNTSGAINVQ